jgi:hypothetical protein
MPSNVELTAESVSDLAVATGLRVVYWLFVEAKATGGAWSLEDGTDDTGTVKISGDILANTAYYFDWTHKPLEMKTGLFLDIAGTNVKMSVGYS